MSAGKEQSMKFAQEAAEKIAKRWPEYHGQFNTPRYDHKVDITAIIEACYNARSGEVTWEETTFGELRKGDWYSIEKPTEYMNTIHCRAGDLSGDDGGEAVYRLILPSPDVKVSPDYSAIRGKLEAIPDMLTEINDELNKFNISPMERQGPSVGLGMILVKVYAALAMLPKEGE